MSNEVVICRMRSLIYYTTACDQYICQDQSGYFRNKQYTFVVISPVLVVAGLAKPTATLALTRNGDLTLEYKCNNILTLSPAS